MKMLFEGQGLDFLNMMQPQYYVDTQDVGRLHAAALTQPGMKGERIFGFAEPWSWNDVLHIFREKFPGHEFVEDFPDLGRDVGRVPNARAAELLRGMYRRGFTPLEESIVENVRCFVSE